MIETGVNDAAGASGRDAVGDGREEADEEGNAIWLQSLLALGFAAAAEAAAVLAVAALLLIAKSRGSGMLTLHMEPAAASAGTLTLTLLPPMSMSNGRRVSCPAGMMNSTVREVLDAIKPTPESIK